MFKKRFRKKQYFVSVFLLIETYSCMLATLIIHMFIHYLLIYYQGFRPGIEPLPLSPEIYAFSGLGHVAA